VSIRARALTRILGRITGSSGATQPGESGHGRSDDNGAHLHGDRCRPRPDSITKRSDLSGARPDVCAMCFAN
jgi:hypothetical protein